jgi:hypothetical protein
MSKLGKSIRIEWPYSHDRGDRDIQSQLEAGGDEGPLLVLSAERSSSPGSVKVIGVFLNVDWYLASLVDDDEVTPRERWVGLVRGSDRDNGDAAVASLQRLALALAPTRKSRPVRGSLARAAVDKTPYGALTEAAEFDGSITIENSGEAFDDVVAAYPMLLPRMSV